eukprot:SAG31_NODE_999_length_10457_cov_3.482622_6_plen_124_part_00
MHAAGWTDTPPVSYEYGGLVVNAAILVDKQYPIVCKARRTDQPVLNLTITDIDGTSSTITCRQLKDLADYTHPQAPAALLKTAVSTNACDDWLNYVHRVSFFSSFCILPGCALFRFSVCDLLT